MAGYNGTINLAPFSVKRVFQRDTRTGDPSGAWTIQYGKGSSAVGLTISPSVAFQSLDYRVRTASAPSGPPLLDWTSCSGPQAAGAVTVSVSLPAALEWFFIDVRANGDSTNAETVGPVGVGEVIAASGQSLASDFWSTVATGDTTTLAACGIVPSPYGVCYASWDGNAPLSASSPWSVPDDAGAYKSSFCAEFLRLAAQGTGVNCALVGYAWSGEPIASWRSDGSGPKDVWSPLIATLDNAVGNGGKLGTLLWMHGHNDARIPQAGVDGGELSADKYLAALATFITALAARYTGYPFRRILSSIPAIGGNWITTSPKFDAGFIQQIRAAHLQFAAGDSLTIGHVDGLDVGLWSDQTHPSQAGNITFAHHFYRAFMAGIGPTKYAPGDSGAHLSGAASRPSGTGQIYLHVVHTGGTTLTCAGGSAGAATQFQVFKSGSTSSSDKVAVQSVDFSRPNVIALSLAATPPDVESLDVWYRMPPDGNAALLAANQIYDDNTSSANADTPAIGRPLAMRPTAVTVPAPLGPRPILVAPGVLLNVGTRAAGLTA